MAINHRLHLPPGHQIGVPTISGYKDLEIIANGRSAVVYSATQIASSRRVAIKINLEGSPYLAAAKCEAAVLRSLRDSPSPSPSIVAMREYFDMGRVVPIVLELHPRNLAQHYQLCGPFPHDVLCGMMRDMFNAIACLRALSPPVIHGDIGPNNFLVDDKGKLALADFGTAQVLDGRPLEPRIHALPLRAPEVMLSDTISPDVDTWAVGGLIFMVTTGKLPFGNANDTGNKMTDWASQNEALQRMANYIGDPPPSIMKGQKSVFFFDATGDAAKPPKFLVPLSHRMPPKQTVVAYFDENTLIPYPGVGVILSWIFNWQPGNRPPPESIIKMINNLPPGHESGSSSGYDSSSSSGDASTLSHNLSSDLPSSRESSLPSDHESS